MAILGDLEQRIMEILWQQGTPISVREVHEILLNDRDLAYTTVMTVLDRLAKKGTARRERDGRAWLYVPAASRADLVSESLLDVLAQAGDSSAEALRMFVASLDDQQRRQLRAALGD